MNSWKRSFKPRRCGALFVIAAYITVSSVFLALHILGDTARHAIAYYFTWDMFPHFDCHSTRNLAVGQTASGRHLELVPGPSELFRGGTRGDLNRADLDREGSFVRRLAEREARRVNECDPLDPVVHIFLFEQFWPVKFNLPDDAYRSWAVEEKPSVWRHWRLRGEFDVTAAPPAESLKVSPMKNAVDASEGERP